MDENLKEWNKQIDEILSRHKDDAEFLRWAVLRLSVLERVIYDRK